MTYTRKPKEYGNATLELDWIEEPVTIPVLDAVPMKHIIEANKGNFGDLLDWLPADLSVLLWEATQEEFDEFFKKWKHASDKRSGLDKAMASTFERLAASMFEPQGER